MINFRDILHKENGQATVELAIVFPVVLIIAVVAVNATLFFSECASFDRLFKQTVVTYAPSPAYGQDLQSTKALIENDMKSSFDDSNLETSVVVEGVAGGSVVFKGKIKMYPTLFGLGLKKEIFGIALPSLSHQSQMAVEVYKPGVIF